MKKFVVLLLFFLLSSCSIQTDRLNETYETDINEEAFVWLKDYDGNWVIKDIFAYFFPVDIDSDTDVENKDKYMG